MTPEARREFLLGLAELTRRTGVEIGGCGCCGSPFLSDADTSDARAGYADDRGDGVRWVAPSDSYDWECYSSGIVR